MSDYDFTGGSLKLKLKEKKKKTSNLNSSSPLKSPDIVVTKTKAEMAHEKVLEKREKDRILKKAAKSHKERVQEMNKFLDSLSEHYDCPKTNGL
ncbi:DUF1754-domain-containing protein [Rozella allomycis CSF55]|uniref:DUF1754-domain-containing protein n=1 Tax=Rozella allomycis (strain CSF55) TaxID=988480 RepID=A0A075ATV8_ROZAC|nr:Protein of unknown function DUF1754, eukaryotic domain-containing protein [Rozella allomycis CSF55]RKP17995.1 DUF1754-domain-containing protein [Rozella allomycis CSF55]|eukprot:EPZ33570.1 Protein of unknown function DUF1754, eukaryotic domain-containing protein [Rozella allomycis CSF55]